MKGGSGEAKRALDVRLASRSLLIIGLGGKGRKIRVVFSANNGRHGESFSRGAHVDKETDGLRDAPSLGVTVMGRRSSDDKIGKGDPIDAPSGTACGRMVTSKGKQSLLHHIVRSARMFRGLILKPIDVQSKRWNMANLQYYIHQLSHLRWKLG